MTWFILCILGIFALATGELVQQHLLNSENSFDERTSTVFTMLFQSFLAMPIVFLLYRSEIVDIFAWDIFLKIIAVSVIGGAGIIFYFKSFKVKNVSISIIFTSCSAIFSTFLGIIFFSESISLLKFGGVFLILLAIFLLNIKNVYLEKNHYYGFLAGFLFSISYSFDKSIVAVVNPLVYAFCAFPLISFFAFLSNPKEVIVDTKSKKLKDFRIFLFSSAGYLLYNMFTFFAYRAGGEMGRIDAINNSEIFLIILFEFFILKQKESLARKIITAIIAVVGIVLLGISK